LIETSAIAPVACTDAGAIDARDTDAKPMFGVVSTRSEAVVPLYDTTTSCRALAATTPEVAVHAAVPPIRYRARIWSDGSTAISTPSVPVALVALQTICVPLEAAEIEKVT
jgi:hypothetical protein